MERSLLSNVALKRNSDLKKAKCMFLSGIACHSKILDKQNNGQINFILDFKSLLSFVLFLVLISFIISFMLDLNSLDCKLLKGQRVYLFSLWSWQYHAQVDTYNLFDVIISTLEEERINGKKWGKWPGL